jgi:hypothetical protein
MWSFYCKPNRKGKGPWMWAIFQPPVPIGPSSGSGDVWSMSTITETGNSGPKVVARVTKGIQARSAQAVIKERIDKKTADGYIHVMDVDAPGGCDGYEPLEGGDSPLVPFLQIGGYINAMAQSAHALRGSGLKLNPPDNFQGERNTLGLRSQTHWDEFQDWLIANGFNSCTNKQGATTLALDEIVINFAIKNILGAISLNLGFLLTLDAYELVTDEPCPIW